MKICQKKKKKISKEKKQISWLNNDLKTKRNDLNTLYKRYLKNPGNQLYKDIYIIQRKLYAKNVKKAKTECWLKFLKKSLTRMKI